MKRTVLIIIVAMIAAGFVFAGGSGENSGAVKKWKLAHVRPDGTSTDIDVKAFIQEVSDKTAGKIQMDIYSNSQLGNYTVVQERLSVGDVELQLAPAGTSVTKAMGIVSAPYLVSTWDDVRKVFARSGALWVSMEKLFEKENIKVLGMYPKYFGGIALAKEPASIKLGEPKGLKIRVPGMKAYEKTAEAYGFIATPIAFSEAFTAIQTGIVDGAIGSGAEGYWSSFRDLTKYYLPVNDHFEMWYLMMSNDTWRKLSDSEKKIVSDAALNFEKKRFATAEGETRDYEKKLEDNGVRIIRYSDAELKAIAKKVETEVWPVIKNDYGADFFDEIIIKR